MKNGVPCVSNVSCGIAWLHDINASTQDLVEVLYFDNSLVVLQLQLLGWNLLLRHVGNDNSACAL